MLLKLGILCLFYASLQVKISFEQMITDVGCCVIEVRQNVLWNPMIEIIIEKDELIVWYPFARQSVRAHSIMKTFILTGTSPFLHVTSM